MVDQIPFAKLRGVITALEMHVTRHWCNAVDRYNNNKTPEALFFAIIAYEELMKLSEYVDCYNKQEGVSIKLQQDLSNHNRKLTRTSRMISSFIESVPEDIYKSLLKDLKVHSSNNSEQRYRDIAKNNEIWREMMFGLNILKQLILYFDWKDGREITIHSYMKTLMTKKQIDDSALYFIKFVDSQIKEVRLKTKYVDDVLFTIPRELSIIAEDKDSKDIDEFLKQQDAELREPWENFVLFMRELYLLGKYLKKKPL